jgi:serine/threonine protein kinase
VNRYPPPTLSKGVATIGGQTIAISHVDLDSLLGSGANGFVFGGTDLTLNRPVAVKIWPPRLDRARPVDHTEQALREARKLATIKSDYVVPVYHAGNLDNGWVYMTMEFFDGVALQDIRESLDENFPIRRMIWTDVARGLDDSESVGAYHGDLHGGNVLVAGLKIAIVDFGTSMVAGRDYSLKRHGRMVHRFANWLLPELNSYLPSPDIPNMVSPEYATRAVGLWVRTAEELLALDTDLRRLTDNEVAPRLSSLGHSCVAPWVDLATPVATWLAQRGVLQRNIERFSEAVAAENERQEIVSPSKVWFGILSNRPVGIAD